MWAVRDLIELVKRYWIGIVVSIVALFAVNRIFGSVCSTTILFGIPCPACGITRATKLMLTGHIRESLEMHPLLILVILGVIIYPIIKKTLKNYRFFINSYVIICVVIFVGFYCYRMWNYFPDVEPLVYREENYINRLYSLFQQRQ